MPWANGRGVTNEVITHPSSEPWVWRISIARVSDDGPFSLLPGVDRALVVGTGHGMRLTVDGARATVDRFSSIQFAGGAETSAELVDGPIDDVNLMVRQGYGWTNPHWGVERRPKGDRIEVGSALAIIVLDGIVRLSTPSATFPFTARHERASRFDALLPDSDAGTTATAMTDVILARALLDRED
jgi:uncharacterized protein